MSNVIDLWRVRSFLRLVTKYDVPVELDNVPEGAGQALEARGWCLAMGFSPSGTVLAMPVTEYEALCDRAGGVE